jgi:hypothetical protein
LEDTVPALHAALKIPRARLDFNSTTSAELSRVPSARGKVTA